MFNPCLAEYILENIKMLFLFSMDMFVMLIQYHDCGYFTRLVAKAWTAMILN